MKSCEMPYEKAKDNNIESTVIKSNISEKNNENVRNDYQIVKIEGRNKYLYTHDNYCQNNYLNSNFVIHKITKT